VRRVPYGASRGECRLVQDQVRKKEVRTAAGYVYQLHIALRGIRPPVWRRVQVPGTLSLAKMHETIQIVFGWTDTHLHKFYIDGTGRVRR